MDLVGEFGEAVRFGRTENETLAGSSRPRSAERSATEQSLRAARDEAYRTEARLRGDRAEFSRAAREQHLERRARLQEADEARPAAPEAAADPRESLGSGPQASPAPPASAPSPNAAAAPTPGESGSAPASPAPQAPPTPAPMAPAPGIPAPAAAATAGSTPTPAVSVGAPASASATPRAEALPGAPATERGSAAVRRAAAPAPPPAPTPEPEPVLEQIRLQLQPGMRQATLALAPAHLGRIAIRMEVRDGEMTAIVRAERPETLAALQANLPELREMLAEAGIEAGQIDLGLAQQGGSEFGPGDEDRQRAARRILQTYLHGDDAGSGEASLPAELLVTGHVDLYA